MIAVKWSRSHRAKLGLLSLAIALRDGTVEVSPEAPTRAIQAQIASGIFSHLANAHTGRPINGGHGRGATARIQRAARERRNVAKRSSKRK